MRIREYCSYSNDDKLITRKLAKFRDNRNLSQDSRKIINKLIGDVKLRKKLKLIIDTDKPFVSKYLSDIVCGYSISESAQFYCKTVAFVKHRHFQDSIKELNYLKNNKDEIIIYFMNMED